VFAPFGWVGWGVDHEVPSASQCVAPPKQSGSEGSRCEVTPGNETHIGLRDDLVSVPIDHSLDPQRCGPDETLSPPISNSRPGAVLSGIRPTSANDGGLSVGGAPPALPEDGPPQAELSNINTTAEPINDRRRLAIERAARQRPMALLRTSGRMAVVRIFEVMAGAPALERTDT
jgi:hypothetical protein